MEKAEILAKFSAEPDKYYKVNLFEEQGYQRKACPTCGKFFWTIDTNRDHCPEDSDDTYSFIGDPPTLKRFDYSQAWNEIKSFFTKNGHTVVNRYPVVCRWRDDLYFIVLSYQKRIRNSHFNCVKICKAEKGKSKKFHSKHQLKWHLTNRHSGEMRR